MDRTHKLACFFYAILLALLVARICGQVGGPGAGCKCNTGVCGGCGGGPWDGAKCNTTYQVKASDILFIT